MAAKRTKDTEESPGATDASEDPMRSSSDWSTGTSLDTDDTAAVSTAGEQPTGGAYGATSGVGTTDYSAGTSYNTGAEMGTGTTVGTATSMGAGTTYETGQSAAGGDRLTEAASNVAERASGTVEMAATQGMTKAAETLTEVAQAVRQSGEQLREQQPQVAGFVDTAAEQLEKASSYLRESDLQDIVYRIEDMARRQPALFIGGAFVLGLAAARFLKSSAGGGGGTGGQGWSTGSASYRDLGYGAGATGYGSTAGYSSRTTDYTGTDDYARTTGGYGSRR